MYKLRIFLVLLTSLVIVQSCSSEDFVIIETPSEKHQIDILIIGNSLSRDAFSYVPSVIKNLCPDVSVDTDILQIGGVALDVHIDALKHHKGQFEHDDYQPENDRWVTNKGIEGTRILTNRKWDMIILQDGSNALRDYKTLYKNIADLKDLALTNGVDGKVYLLLTPSRVEGSEHLEGKTMDEDFEVIQNNAERLKNEDLIEDYIPCGRSIQFARHSWLDELGDYGHLSYDGRHLQEGIPCYLEALTASQFILNKFGLKANVYDCSLRITNAWVKKINVPGQHGYVIAGTDADYELSKLCALKALTSRPQNTYDFVRASYPQLFKFGHFKLEAHRGFSAKYPENTLLAFREAAKLSQFSAIETDVQMTKDGFLVCMHDDKIDRTTNGSGSISSYTYDELKTFRIAGGMGWNDEYRDSLIIPTLSDYLLICKEYGKIPYIEMKRLSKSGIKATVECLHNMGFDDDSYVLTSSNLSYIIEASNLCNAPLEFMQETFTKDDIEKYSQYRNLVLRVNAKNVNKELVEMCHNYGLLLECYGIPTDDRQIINKLKVLGIEGGTCNTYF